MNQGNPKTLFVISVYIITNCSDDATKNEFYDEVNSLLSMRNLPDSVNIAADFKEQVG